ncbi:MAG: HAD family hydrolase [Bacteroidales bacterium]
MISQAIAKYEAEKGEKISLKAVLFDMDGVLFDSMGNHTLSWYNAIQEQNIECNRDEFYLFEGATGNFTINRLFNIHYNREATDAEKDHIYKRKSHFFNQLPKAEPMPFAYELLNTVKLAGLVPILVTGSGQRSLLDRLNVHFPDVFTADRMVTAYDVKNGKPHPEPYLRGLKKINIQPHEAIVIENAPLGVQSAAAAGIFTVAVNTGPIDDHILMDAGADVLFDSMEDLYRNWEKIYALTHTAD